MRRHRFALEARVPRTAVACLEMPRPPDRRKFRPARNSNPSITPRTRLVRKHAREEIRVGRKIELRRCAAGRHIVVDQLMLLVIRPIDDGNASSVEMSEAGPADAPLIIRRCRPGMPIESLHET